MCGVFLQILSCLIEKGYQWALQASLKSGKEGPAKAHMALVAYCDKFLRIKEDGKISVLCHECCALSSK